MGSYCSPYRNPKGPPGGKGAAPVPQALKSLAPPTRPVALETGSAPQPLPSGNTGRPGDSREGPCTSAKPWTLPAQGLAVFHGGGNTGRLSHYFLPRLLLQGKRILFLDGANCADPRLLERLARQRGVPFAEFNRQIQIARAFTCFQLTELIARVPRFLEDFSAQVLVVTAFPDLYFDEDVGDWDARVAFERALAHLRRWASPRLSRSAGLQPGMGCAGLKAGATTELRASPASGTGATEALAIALFSSAATFIPSLARRRFFEKTCAAASEVWKFSVDENNRLGLTCEHMLPRALSYPALADMDKE